MEKATGFLKDNGVLLLAMENRMGLKYWAGAPEDHTARKYDGICGYPDSPSPRTFSIAEMKTLLKTVGFPCHDLYLPFPDYKIPSSVLTPSLVARDAELAAAVAAGAPFESYSGSRARSFPELLALDSIASAGLFTEMTNSFLFLATKAESSSVRRALRKKEEAGDLGWHYAVGREAATCTRFFPKGDATWVEKAALSGKLGPSVFETPHFKVEWIAAPPAPVLAGTPFRQLFGRLCYFEEAAPALELLEKCLSSAVERWEHEDGTLSGEALDAITKNCVVLDSEKFEWFDLEWRLQGSLSESWFVLRNVLALLPDRGLLPRGAPFRRLSELYEHLCHELGATPRLHEDVHFEAELQARVSAGATVAQQEEALLKALKQPLSRVPYPRESSREEDLLRLMVDRLPLKKIRRLASRFPV